MLLQTKKSDTSYEAVPVPNYPTTHTHKERKLHHHHHQQQQTKQTIARLAHCVKLVRKKVNKQNVTGKIYLYSCIVEKK